MKNKKQINKRIVIICSILLMLLNGLSALQAKHMSYKKAALNVKPQSCRYNYAGQEKEGELKSKTEIYNYRARAYDTKLRVFLSPDKAKQQYGAYTTCRNNPINFVDKDGNEFTLEELQLISKNEVFEFKNNMGGMKNAGIWMSKNYVIKVVDDFKNATLEAKNFNSAYSRLANLYDQPLSAAAAASFSVMQQNSTEPVVLKNVVIMNKVPGTNMEEIITKNIKNQLIDNKTIEFVDYPGDGGGVVLVKKNVSWWGKSIPFGTTQDGEPLIPKKQGKNSSKKGYDPYSTNEYSEHIFKNYISDDAGGLNKLTNQKAYLDPEMRKSFEQLQKSLKEKKVAHLDFHYGNIHFDSQTNKFYLIDLKAVKIGNLEENSQKNFKNNGGELNGNFIESRFSVASNNNGDDVCSDVD